MDENEPILDDNFLKTIFQYEYLKNGQEPRQAHKNVSEMMISDVLREEVETKYTAPRDSSDEVSEEGPAPVAPRAVEGPSSTDTLDGADSIKEEVVPGGRPSEGSDDVKPGKRRIRVSTGASNRTSGSFYSTDSDDSTIEVPPGAKFILLKKDEEDNVMDGISFDVVCEMFNRYGDGWLGFEETHRFRRMKIRLAELRKLAYTFVWLTLPPNCEDRRVHPFHHLTVVTDLSKIKIHLSSEFSEYLKIEFWETTNGCMVWNEDSARFIKDFDFETLAASEFIEISKFSLGPNPVRVLDSLRFDIEEKSKWSQEGYHSVDFIRKIKRYIRKEHPNQFMFTRRYFMKLYLYKRNLLCLPIDQLKSGILGEITIRVWDDSHITNQNQRRTPYLNTVVQTEQWKNAIILDIDDQNLVEFAPEIGSFELVRRWGEPDLMNMLPETVGMITHGYHWIRIPINTINHFMFCPYFFVIFGMGFTRYV